MNYTGNRPIIELVDRFSDVTIYENRIDSQNCICQIVKVIVENNSTVN